MDWEWYSNIPTTRLFIHLLLIVNTREKVWRGETIPRGCVITSISTLQQATGLTTQQVRNSLKNLKTTREITYRATNRYSVISIKNYEQYQQRNTQTNTLDNKPNNKQNNKQTTSQPTTTKEYKEYKNNTEGFVSKFNELSGRAYVVTEAKRKLLSSRLKSFTYEQIEEALTKMFSDSFYKGENDRSWSATPDWFLKNDDRIDGFLNKQTQKKLHSSLNPL